MPNRSIPSPSPFRRGVGVRSSWQDVEIEPLRWLLLDWLFGEVSPDQGQIDLDRLEGLRPYFLRVLVDRRNEPASFMEAQDLEGARHRVHQPDVRHTLPGIDRQLRDPVEPHRRG